MPLRPYQESGIKDAARAWSQGHKSIVLVAPGGSGKCLGPEVPVLMYSGQIKPAGEVQVGDTLMGLCDSRKVLSVNRGHGQLYRIVPTKGDPWICNDAHILTLIESGGSRIIDISVMDYLAQNEWFKDCYRLFMAPITMFPVRANPPIDPHFLGLWFGDGTKSMRGVSISKPDPEVLAECHTVASQWGLHVTTWHGKTCPTHRLSMPMCGGQSNRLLDTLRDLVGDSVTIPDAIKYGSIHTRSEFLSGIVDSDGYHTNGCYEIVQKRKDWVEDIAFIARSLGYRVTIREKIVNGTSYYRIFISGDISNIPARIPRKKAKPRLQIKCARNTGFTIEDAGFGEYAGFTLDGDGRFLLGDFTVTHNTEIGVEMVVKAFAHDAFITDCTRQFDCFWIAGRLELLSQPYARFVKRGIRAGVIKAGIGKLNSKTKPGEMVSNPLARLQIASIQTVINRVILPTQRKRALVFIDEGHHCKASQYLAIMESLKRTYIEVFFVLLTATPYRGDHQGLGDVATKLIEVTTPKQLVEAGWICNPEVKIGQEDNVTLPVAIDGDFNIDASAAQADKPHLIANIVDEWRKYCSGYPGWGFAINVAHSQHIVERFNAAGIKAAHLDGMTSSYERKRILARSSIGGFASDHPMGLDVVSNVDVLTEGTDPDSCYQLVLEDPDMRDLWLGKSYPPEQNPLGIIGDWARTKSMGKFIQRLVRASRIHPKKTHAVYLDHAGNEARHCQLLQHEGFTLDDGSNVVKARLVKKATKTAVLNCPVCGMAFKPPLANCADCGSALGVAGNVDLEALAEAPGELVPSVAQPNLPRKQLPHEQEAWLHARLVWWESENAGRVARGLPAYKRGHFYHTANAAFLAKFKRPMDVGVFEKVMGR